MLDVALLAAHLPYPLDPTHTILPSLGRYEEKAAEEAARQAEQKRLEQAAEAEAAAQRAKQEAKYKRRQLKEVVAWVKTAARAPGELQNRPIVAQQRAQRAAKLIGSMNAVAAEEEPAAAKVEPVAA